MEQATKRPYESPSSLTVELKYGGVLCDSEDRDMWYKDGDTMRSNTNWGRGDYGGANEI